MSGPTLAPPPAAEVPGGAEEAGRRGDTSAGSRRPPGVPRLRPAAALGLAFAAYLALAVALWWQVWSTHPTSTAACGCGDPSLFLWFLAWPAYAVQHGHDPFFSTALFHPGGIDLLANTSVLAIGLPLAPVTWLWGPVATLNVASTLTPALGALSMCWLLRRWVSWAPAAFVGGLVFGFSPFVVTNLASAHLMTAALALLPLIVACLDELLVRQRHGAGAVGAALGLLLAVQFFVGTEVLVMAVLMGGAAVVLVVAYAAVGHRDELAARAPHAARGLGVAALVAVVLLAYPAWVALAGPAHFSGRLWPAIAPGTGGITPAHLWRLAYGSPAAVRLLSGYQGPALPTGAYLGVGLLAVLACGLVAFRRDRRLWCFGGLGLVAMVLALGVQRTWTPWRILAHVPLVQELIPARVVAVLTLCAAVMLGVVLDRTRGAVLSLAGAGAAPGARSRGNAPAARARHRAGGDGGGTGARLAAGVVALAVAAVAVVPMASAVASNMPLTARPVVLPRWFSAVAPTLPPGRVVLTFPLPAVGGDTMAWQAVAGLPFAMATGSGPGSVLRRAGAERAGQEVLLAGSSLFGAPPALTPARVAAVRRALRGWGVTVVAVPDARYLVPPYDRPTATAWALALFTAVLGRAPAHVGGTWVWRHATAPATPLAVTAARLALCTAPVTAAALGAGGAGRAAPRDAGAQVAAVPGCVLAAAGP